MGYNNYTDIITKLAWKWLVRAKENGCSEEDLDTMLQNAWELYLHQ